LPSTLEAIVLDVRDVVVSFQGNIVLGHVSVHVERGETVALLGPSGSGKSTLLRVIAGIVEQNSGTVMVGGRDVTHLPTHLRSVGMVFQDEQLFPHISVGDNVAFGLKVAGMRPAERRHRSEELLRAVGLGGFANRSIQNLSGGERKRVALARSLAPNPSVLLLDEPLTGLDRDLHDRLARELVAVLHERGTTALWVTHDREEAQSIAKRSIVFAS
jgi:thiamine transport system ATP-binding protein